MKEIVNTDFSRKGTNISSFKAMCFLNFLYTIEFWKQKRKLGSEKLCFFLLISLFYLLKESFNFAHKISRRKKNSSGILYFKTVSFQETFTKRSTLGYFFPSDLRLRVKLAFHIILNSLLRFKSS